MDSRHFVYLLSVHWYSPILLLAIAAISLAIIKKFFADYLQRWGLAMSNNQIEVDEDLPYFYDAIKYFTGKEMI